MVALSILAACGGVNPIPDSVRGLQVVAIESVPPQPEPLEGLELRTWVADGVGRGADVIVWLCTPIEGRCVEAVPPGSTGLPLSTWTRVGRADPVFSADVAWPLFASIADNAFTLPEEARGKLLVWALACAPGVCPLVEQIQADPLSGSEAWHAAAAALANPQEWIDDLPRGQVSLAVKVVPVWLEDRPSYPYGIDITTTGPLGPNQAPTIVEVTEDVRVDTGGPPFLPGGSGSPGGPSVVTDPLVSRLRVSDLDNDLLSVRAFVTAGGVVTSWAGESDVAVLWQEPISPLHRQVGFVVVDDARGGTAVWTTDPPDPSCERWSISAAPLETGQGVPLQRSYDSIPYLLLDGTFAGPSRDVVILVRVTDAETGDLLGEGIGEATGGWSPATCEGSFRDLLVQFWDGWDPDATDYVCALGGKRVRIALKADPIAPFEPAAEAEVEVVLELPPTIECTR